MSLLATVQEYGSGIENPKDAGDELAEYLERRLLDPSLPIPESIQRKMDDAKNLHPEVWNASMEFGRQMVEQLQEQRNQL